MRADHVLLAGAWEASQQIDTVLIDFDHRHRRRIVLTTETGADLLIDLPQAVRLRDGDGLRTRGGVVRVRAKPEPLLEIHAHDAGELVRIAWHLGNRHLPVQLLGDRICIRADHVIGAMIEGLGGHVAALDAPFDPEPGAYAGDGGAHHHHHDDDHDNETQHQNEIQVQPETRHQGEPQRRPEMPGGRDTQGRLDSQHQAGPQHDHDHDHGHDHG